MPRSVSLAGLLSVGLFILLIPSVTSAQKAPSPSTVTDCNVDLKPTDGYKELTEKLKCLAREISKLKQGSGGVIGAPKVVTGEPMEAPSCIKSSTLPAVSTIVLRTGVKFCRDDGSVWLRVIGTDNNSVTIALPDKNQNSNCYLSNASCTYDEAETKQRLRIQVELAKDAKGKEAMIGSVRKLALE